MKSFWAVNHVNDDLVFNIMKTLCLSLCPSSSTISHVVTMHEVPIVFIHISILVQIAEMSTGHIWVDT